MNHLKAFILCIVLSLTQNSLWAADLVGIKKLFEESFWTSHYVENHCGRNIEKLVEKAMDKNLDLRGAEIIELQGGGWKYGLVNALAARESGRGIIPRPIKPPYRLPGENNWHFHVFLVVNGRVMDYDFTNQPRVETVLSYFHQMYLPANAFGNVSYKEDKLGRWEVTRYPAEDYILRKRQKLPVQSIGTHYLKEVIPGLFKPYRLR